MTTPLTQAKAEEKSNYPEKGVIKKATSKSETSTVKEKPVAAKPIEKNAEKASCYHHGFTSGSLAQIYIQYACDISNNDVDFILTMNAENGGWNIKRASDLIGKNGYRDYGLCQVNKGYHPNIVNDPRFFTDYKRHIEQCYSLYKGGTRFYGFDVRYKRSRGLVSVGNTRF